MNQFINSSPTSIFLLMKLPFKIRHLSIKAKYGLDISSQRARKVSVKDFDTFDRIFAMDQSNYDHLLLLARTDLDISKIKLILNEAHPNQNRSVPDPYDGESSGFENVYSMLDEACECILKKL